MLRPSEATTTAVAKPETTLVAVNITLRWSKSVRTGCTSDRAAANTGT